jgi:CBS domain-containing protein
MNEPEIDPLQQHSMASPLSAIVARAPVSCLPDASLRSALTTMTELKIGSMIVADREGAPLGIFTLRDVLVRVALPGRSLDEPVSAVMSRSVFALPPQTSAYEAALAMVTRSIRHVLVVDQGKLVGLVSEKDLFNLQRLSLHQLPHALRHAESQATLELLSADIRQLAHNMLERGVAAEQLTYLIATLNDLLTIRVIELELNASGLADVRLCWLALGSEGRFEQTLVTDQDNGIVFAADGDADAIRARLLPFALRVNETLARCGFPLCKGGIMASNPQWCLSVAEWRRQFSLWIDSGNPEALLHSTIFFDFRGLHGDTALADELRGWLLGRTAANARFLHQMAANALRNQAPLGWLQDFVTASDAAHRDTLDLKMSGATLFADAARIYSLAHGIARTNTAARLNEFGARQGLAAREVQAWTEAFDFIQMLRMRHQHLQNAQGAPMDNRVNPADLNALERRILKEALRLARELQRRIALDYGL